MYIPAHFAADEATVDELLRNHGAADLVTLTDEGMMATLLPFIYEPSAGTPSAGRHGALHGHLARNNAQWKRESLGEALVIVRGPDAYITPGWYASKTEHGRVVPTWNYVTAHVYGRFVVHDDPAWTENLVRRLTAKHEAYRKDDAWSVDDAPRAFIEGQLRAIVGVELEITRIEAKAKLSQNRPEADIAGVIAGLRERGDAASADAVERATAKP
jgi:transcriptional regulator